MVFREKLYLIAVMYDQSNPSPISFPANTKRWANVGLMLGHICWLSFLQCLSCAPFTLCWPESNKVVLYHTLTKPSKRWQVGFGLVPANTRRWHNIVLMLGRRRRRRANIKTTLGQPFVFTRIWLNPLPARDAWCVFWQIFIESNFMKMIQILGMIKWLLIDKQCKANFTRYICTGE